MSNENITRETMQLALEALELCEWADNSGTEYDPQCQDCGERHRHKPGCKVAAALDSLREALAAAPAAAQPAKDETPAWLAVKAEAQLLAGNGHIGDLMWAVREYGDKRAALAAAPAATQPPKPLTDEQIEAGREATFSTDNPYCPCSSKTMRKAVRWAERAHGIGAAAPAGEQSA